MRKYKKRKNRFFVLSLSALKSYMDYKHLTYKNKKILLVSFTAIIFIMLSLFFDLGFDLYINGQFVGTVRGYSEQSEIINNISREYGADLAQKNEMYLKLVPKKIITDKNDIITTAKIVLGFSKNAIVCKINGQEVFYTISRSDSEQALSDYTARFSDYADGFIDADIKLDEVLISSNKISNVKAATDLLAEYNVPVKTIEYTDEIIETQFETQEIADNKMVKGDSVVKQKGEKGLASQKYKIVRVNGKMIEKEVLNSDVVVPAVAEIKSVGTLEKGVGCGTFIYPVKAKITSGFGSRWGKNHYGIDFGANLGTPIHASDNGVVIFCGVQTGYGNVIILDHNNGYKTIYAHCNELYPHIGDTVKSGDVIACVGNTGNSTGPHLHFEIKYNDIAKDPLKILK